MSIFTKWEPKNLKLLLFEFLSNQNVGNFHKIFNQGLILKLQCFSFWLIFRIQGEVRYLWRIERINQCRAYAYLSFLTFAFMLFILLIKIGKHINLEHFPSNHWWQCKYVSVNNLGDTDAIDDLINRDDFTKQTILGMGLICIATLILGLVFMFVSIFL